MIWIFSWSMLAALRYINDMGVGGSDAYMYMTFFKSCSSFWKMINAAHFDIGFKLFTFIVRLFTDNYHIYAFICAFILVGSYAIVVQRLCPSDINTIPLVLIFYLFLRGFTTYRTNLSVAFFLIGIVCLYEKKYVRSLLLMVISVLFHKSSIIYALIVPFMIIYNKRKLSVKESVALVCLGCVLGRIIQTVMLGAFGTALGDAYQSYASRSVGKSFFDGFWKIAFEQMILSVPMLIYRTKINRIWPSNELESRDKIKFVWNVCIFDFIMIPTTYTISLWRGYEYLYIFRLIMWGTLLEIFLKRFSYQSKVLIKIVALSIFLIWFVWRVCKTYEPSGLLPYVYCYFI